MRHLVEKAHPEISVRRQCELLGLNRAGLYYEPLGESEENLRLMTLLGVEAVYPNPKLSQPGAGHKIYPYLLREVEVSRVNQVWSNTETVYPMVQDSIKERDLPPETSRGY